MKQVIGWTILVALVLICAGFSIFSLLQSRRLAQELAAAQARSQTAEETVRELRDLVARLKQEPSHSEQDQSSTNAPAESLASAAPWATSDDGQLQVKFAAERDVSRPGQPMNLLCVVKNKHSQAITIDAPMLDPWDIDLSQDGQRVRFRGPVPNPALPRPVPLQPGELATFQSRLTLEDFAELANKGVFQVEYTYRSGFENNWKGSIGPLTARWVNE